MSEETKILLLFNSNAIRLSKSGGRLWGLFTTYWIR